MLEYLLSNGQSARINHNWHPPLSKCIKFWKKGGILNIEMDLNEGDK